MSIKKIIIILFIIFPFSLQELIKNETIIDQNKTKVRTIRGLVEDWEETNPKLGGVFSLVMEIVAFIYDYLNKNGIDHVLQNENFTRCIYKGFLENLEEQKTIRTCIDGSGKALNDFGNEFLCDNTFVAKARYFTLHFSLNNYSTIQSNESINILKFLDQHYFYIGLCLPIECKEAMQYLVEEKRVLQVIHEKGNLSNFKLYYKDDVVNMAKDIKIIYKIIIGIYLFIFIIKIVVGTIRINVINEGYQVYFTKKQDKKKLGSSEQKKMPSEKEKLNKEKNQEDDEDNDDKGKGNSSLLSMQYNEKDSDISDFYNQSITGSKNVNDELILYNPFVDEVKYPLYAKIIKIFDFYDNVNILSVLSNSYYNSFQINRLYLIRLILMLMSIMYQIVYTQLDLPYRYYINPYFYKNINFIIIKFCVNASTFWITLDSVLIGYKIMSYMKKEAILSKRGTIDILSHLKFLLLVIPKFVIFFFAFVFLHIFASNLTFELCKPNKVYSSFLYYKDTVQNRTYSIRQTEGNFRKIYKNFIPFKLNYIDYFENVKSQKDIELYNGTDTVNNDTENNSTNGDYTKSFTFDASGYELPSPFLTNTDLFVNVYFNEFYLLILMLFISYLSYKLRSKIFDYAILGINIILFFVPLLKLSEENKNQYTLRYVLGQNYSEKYTHYFINFFYFGFIIGVMKFYNDENLSNLNKKNQNLSDLKLPFQFFQTIIIAINKLKLRYKRIILLLSLFFIFLIASSFKFMQNSDNEDLELYDLKGWTLFLFLYEKNLSGIFFFIFLLMYIVYPKTTNIIKLAERNGFIILERISSSFYSSFCYLIYAQFCIFTIYFQFTYMNLFLNTLGMFLIINTFSLFKTTLLELPLRQLIKAYMNKDFKAKFKYYYNKNRNYNNNLNNSIRNV